MAKPLRQAEVDPKSAFETLRKLAPHGFGDAEFELVHHWGAKGKLIRFKNHCEKLIESNGLFRSWDNNHLLHLRLFRILRLCIELPAGGKNFRSLAEEALAAHSPIDKNGR
jgi:hypothetical protein